MMRWGGMGGARAVAAASVLVFAGVHAGRAQERNGAEIIRRIDDATLTRHETILGYTVREHYSVFRGADQAHPAAEMTVETTYRKGAGKSYSIVSQSGSTIIRRFGLLPLLDQEKAINAPGTVEKSWFTSANYDMNLKPGMTRVIDGRNCIAVSMSPKRKAPNMIEGTLWVDAGDDSLVEMDGVASKAPSMFAGRTQMMRQYRNMNGFAMATNARAESDSGWLGKTVVTIEYQDYKIDLQAGAGGH